MNPIKMQIAERLLDLGCFQCRPQNPFTYASGLKGPIYCDNRLLISHVKARTEVIHGFLNLIYQNFPEKDLQPQIIAGMATAGIPHAAWISHELQKPLIYVRSQAKGHGKGNLIEGSWQNGNTAVLIEDLVNQGKSSAQGLDALIEAQIRPLALFCIVDYQMKAAQREFQKRDCPLISLTDFSTLIQAALHRGLIDKRESEMVQEWHESLQS